MMAKVILLVLTVTAASARHVYNADRYLVKPLNSESGSTRNDQLVQRRNVEYGSGVNNVPQNPEVPYEYYQVQDHSTVRNQGNLNVDSHNYIGNENDFRLKTSLNQPRGRRLDGNVDLAYTNVNTKVDINDMSEREAIRRVATTQRVNVILPAEGSLKTNVNIDERRGDDRTRSEVPANRPTEHTPKEAQNENETWVWGLDTGNTTKSLPDDDLDDRVALAGDRCPTGYARIGGKCVEKL